MLVDSTKDPATKNFLHRSNVNRDGKLDGEYSTTVGVAEFLLLMDLSS